jgi:hypothetical protein
MRRLVIGSVLAASAAAAVLLVAAIGTAGTNSVLFQAFEGPSALHTGKQGLVFAKFKPSGSSGSATHTVIRFTFPSGGLVSGLTPDPDTSSDCAPSGTDPNTIQCTIGTVNPGQLVERFITFTAGTTVADIDVEVSVSFDAGSAGAKGGGKVNPPDPIDLPVSIVDGTSADGACTETGGSISTAPVDSTVLQQTQLQFGTALVSFPCTWGSVAILKVNGKGPGGGAPEISSVDGPTFGTQALLTLSFSSLPQPLSKYVLKESHVSPDDASPGDWKAVPLCTSPDAATADTCLQGYDNGKVIVAHLLFRGTGTDPWFN